MMTTATQNEHYNAHEPVLFMAFELSEKTWKLGFTLGHGQPPRERTIAARDTQRLLNEVGIGKSNGLFHRLRPPTPCHPAATLPADARAWGRPVRPAPAAGQRWMPPAGRRLAPQRTDRTGGRGRAACTAGAARGEAARGD